MSLISGILLYEKKGNGEILENYTGSIKNINRYPFLTLV